MPQYWEIFKVPLSCLMTEPESALSEYAFVKCDYTFKKYIIRKAHTCIYVTVHLKFWGFFSLDMGYL